MFIKCDVPRDNDPIGAHIQTPITFMLGRIAKKHTQHGSWGEFVGNSGRKVTIAVTPEDSKMCVRRG